jgi:undecaprenyl-diphosphatase
MQYGVFVTIPIATVVAWRLRHHRLAVLLAVSGVSIYVLAKIVKRVADRGRPDAFLDTVNEREAFAAGSLGYTSGHVAVAATIATLTVLHLPRRWGQVSVVLVAIVAVGRMYVGAHLPLDMIGGVAMGVAAGTAATFVSRRVASRAGHR